MLAKIDWCKFLLLSLFFTINGLSLEKNNNIFKLTILHTNDMHARFAEVSQFSSTCTAADKLNNSCYGGFARVAHIIREARSNASRPRANSYESGEDDDDFKNLLVLNAGDTYTGSPYFTLFNSTISTEFINYLNFDALSLGNHEFDLDVPGLVPFINGVKSPILCANIDTKDEPSLNHSKLKSSIIIEKGGQRIGIIGYLTNETCLLAKTGKVKFLSEIEIINQESEKLVEQGVNIIIALGHSGFYMDKEIAKNCPLVDLVIGGHTNTFLYTGTPPDIEVPVGPYPLVVEQESGKKVPVVQAFAYTKYVGQLFLHFDETGNLIKSYGNPILVSPNIPQDADILQALKRYDPAVEALQKRQIGKTLVFLDQNECRVQECNIGNLISDACVYYHAKRYSGRNWTDAPIALMNGGGIRTSLGSPFRKTNLTYADLLSTLPFNNDLVSVNVTGNELIEILKLSITRIHVHGGGFLQVSGIHVVYDLKNGLNNPTVRVKVRCSDCSTPSYNDLVPNKKYTLLINSFLGEGGDGYNVFIKKYKYIEGITINDLVGEYIKQFSPLITAIEDRIKIVNYNSDSYHESNIGDSSNSIKGSLSIVLILFLINKFIY